jgi:outer membrane protein TolC
MRSTIFLAAVGALCGAIMMAGCESNRPAAFGEYSRLSSAPVRAASGPADEKNLPRLTDQSSPAEYLAFAALNNPGLEAAFERWKAAMEMIPQARALPDPQFTFSYFVVAQAMRDGDMRLAYEISQTFPWFGKLQLKGDMAAAEAQGAYQRYEAQRLAVFARVKDAYYEYYYLARAVEITKENVDRLKSIELIAHAKYRNATGSQPDLIRVQVELGKMENELESMRDMRTPIAARLNAALGRPADAPLPDAVAPGGSDDAIAEGQLQAWMEQSNPELKAMDSDIVRELKGIALAGKDYYPDLMLGVEYDQMVRASGVSMSPMNPIAVMVSVNIPIWWDKYAAGVRQAQARYNAATKDKQDKANSLGSEIKMESYNFRNAQRKLVLYRDTLLPKAAAAMKSTLSSYQQTGGATFADLIDTQRTLLEFQLNYERANADRRQALARLEAIVGRPIASAGGTEGTTSSQPATVPGGSAGG